jgi:tRNA pseudouridine38-40 synthase
MQNIKLIVAYDGTAYRGWQKTPMGPSIEATLQQTLEQILQQPTPLQAASRTDGGVHAQGQVVNFFTTKHIDLDRLQISLNSLLPCDIVVLAIEKMDPHFHPTLDCKGKEYRYFICHRRTQLPHRRLYAWHYHYLLDFEAMRKAAEIFVGQHDFSAFCNFKKNAHYMHTIRELSQIELMKREEDELCIRLVGNHFLYKMVRNIVGAIVYVGRGKLKIEDVLPILNSGDRKKAGMTAPAHGLFLHQVFY